MNSSRQHDAPVERTDELMRSLGFRCGVEIHQQLLTDRKLFCRCPAGYYTREHHAEVLRHMRPTLSEMGVYDPCALMEFKTKKEILYLLNKDSVCTYELDDTPPFPINEQALDISIELAMLNGCSIVDEMHIARKQYLDGSIPTGFQRTAIVGINGEVPFEGGTIGVLQLSIEEDSCREVSDKGHTIRFRTDRLGTPLIEVVTAPCFSSPEQAARGVRHLGRLLRASGKVRRGLGATRQDVNVSIDGGCRVEIKGVPRYQLMTALTRTEALRQKALLDLREELRSRQIQADSLQSDDKDLGEALRLDASPVLAAALQRGEQVRGIRLAGCAGLLRWPTQPGRTFASELAGRVRVIACLQSEPILVHTEDPEGLQALGLDGGAVRHALGLGDRDAGVVVWGPPVDAGTAIAEVRDRVREACEGVPSETRQHLGGGLTDFERLLPGPDRMYPDTDHPPVRLLPDRVQRIRQTLPEPAHAREQRFERHGLPADVVPRLALSRHVSLVDALADEGLNMKLVGRLVGQTARSLERQGVDLTAISDARWRELVLACEHQSVPAKLFARIVRVLAEDPQVEPSQVVATLCSDPCHAESGKAG